MGGGLGVVLSHNAAADDALRRVVHAPVLGAEALATPLVADPGVHQLPQEGALQRPVDDDVLQAVALGEALIVVDLVEVAGGRRPHHQLLRTAVLQQSRTAAVSSDQDPPWSWKTLIESSLNAGSCPRRGR